MASVGDAENPLTWSGIPYHLSQAGREVGFITGGLPLDPSGRSWKAQRLAWNLAQVLRGDRKGGFQYSVGFLERLWAPVQERLTGAAVINCAQLYPPSVVVNDAVEKWFFLDLTLELVLDYYRTRESVGRRIAEDALARERAGYARARGLIVMSHFAAANVRERYGVGAERVHVVVPGANLSPAAYARWEAERDGAETVGADGKLRLLMITTDWQRKGLDRLLRAIAIGRRQGLQVSLKVIGARREDLPAELTALDDVTWLGRISKNTHADRFLREVAGADMGCIFSRYEAGGSVLREYHALGLAAFATNAGGMPDFFFDDATVAVAPDASDEELATALVALGKDHARVARLKAAAERRRREALWPATVEHLRAVIDAGPDTR
ncbi:MAG TPA: glycosyltransferase family 4 protein [Polyangia bacterium]|nr:glycosyltransferase family 4 protein [Polyangia bacterium]